MKEERKREKEKERVNRGRREDCLLKWSYSSLSLRDGPHAPLFRKTFFSMAHKPVEEVPQKNAPQE
jgi:hypothetical protein